MRHMHGRECPQCKKILPDGRSFAGHLGSHVRWSKERKNAPLIQIEKEVRKPVTATESMKRALGALIAEREVLLARAAELEQAIVSLKHAIETVS